MRTMWTMAVAGMLAAGALAGVSDALAAKGGNKPGGGGDGGGEPAVLEIVAMDGSNLVLLSADGATKQRVLRSVPGVAPQPAWSLDGTRVVFNATYDGPGIYTVGTNGNGRTRIASLSSQYASGPDWSPVAFSDGSEWVLFEDAGVGGQRDVFAVRPDGTDRTNLTSSSGVNESAVAWSPDGSQFAVVSGWTSDEVLIYDVTVGSGGISASVSESVTNVTDGPLAAADIEEIAWSRDGDELAVTALVGADGLPDVWIIPVASPASATRLTNTPTINEDNPSWSPDDSELLVSQVSGSKSATGLFAITRATGATRSLDQGKGRSADWK